MGRVVFIRPIAIIVPMTRTVGRQPRNEFILDPVEAWHRGRQLDRMLGAARPVVQRGVTRAPHDTFNRLDDQRQLEIARRLNSR